MHAVLNPPQRRKALFVKRTTQIIISKATTKARNMHQIWRRKLTG